MYNQKNYKQLNQKEQNVIIYQCFQPQVREYIATLNTNNEIKTHIEDLYRLITYQMQRICKQESEIVSIKHKNAWKHYDRSFDHDNESGRRCLTTEEIKTRKC
jgi:hypothetical protein